MIRLQDMHSKVLLNNVSIQNYFLSGCGEVDKMFPKQFEDIVRAKVMEIDEIDLLSPSG